MPAGQTYGRVPLHLLGGRADPSLDCQMATQIRGPLAVLISLLALADGVLHLSLNFVLFRGNLFGSLGPPPGAPAPPGGGGPPSFLVPLNQAFTLNLIGYVVLVLLFLSSARASARGSGSSVPCSSCMSRPCSWPG